MKKLDKATIARRDEIVASLQTQYADLEGAVDGFNDNMGPLWTAIEEAVQAYNDKLDDEWGNGLGPMIEQYNEAVANANEWKQDVAASIQEYMDERSEKWQESDAAGRYREWLEAFDGQCAECDIERPEDVSIDEPEAISFESVEDLGEELEQLPTELDAGS